MPDGMEARAHRLGRVIVSLRSTELRVSWLREALRSMPASDAADVLESVCVLADQADLRAEAVLHALVELLADPSMGEAREALRAEARSRKLLTLERLLRRPFLALPKTARPSPSQRSDLHSGSSGGTFGGRAAEGDDEIAITFDDTPRERDVPDYGRGRPLTLGERKALARRPPPELLPKILADPHPDVIRNLLMTPRLTEDDVVRMCTRRPNRAEVLAEVARHPRWCQRPRVRIALVLNPTTPTEISMSMIALLRRDELSSVIRATGLHPAIRAAARERFERRPPVVVPNSATSRETVRETVRDTERDTEEDGELQ